MLMSHTTYVVFVCVSEKYFASVLKQSQQIFGSSARGSLGIAHTVWVSVDKFIHFNSEKRYSILSEVYTEQCHTKTGGATSK